MKPISPTTHGVVDYMFILFCAIAPSLFPLDTNATRLLFVVAGGYLVVTLLTNMTYGVVRVIPFRVHGVIEAVAGAFLLAVPWLFGFADHPTSRNLFLTLGIVTYVVFFLTDWREERLKPIAMA